ncbi:MAG: MFS transporter, partial [Paracoccaceae bacterium]
DGIRATYLSVQSLAGRLLFAATLGLAARQSPDAGVMPYADIRVVLAVYAAFGVAVLAALAVTARRAGV